MTASAVALALAANPACALMLGEPDVRSYLGRPLDVRIPVQGAGAQDADASCFTLDPEASAGVTALTRAQFDVEQQAGRTYLRIRTSEPMREPATMLRLRAACPPTNGILVRQYGILLDPVPASQPSAPLVAQVQPATGSVPAAVARVAATQVPQDIPTAASHTPRHHAAGKSKRQAPRTHLAPKLASTGGFHLKLSGPVLDLEPSRHIDEAQRAQLREARAMLDDDYTSAMLALRDRIDRLQKRLAELQLQSARLDTAARAEPSAAAAVPKTPREQPAVRSISEAAWSWALVALLGLAALLLPLLRLFRRRRAAETADLVVKTPPDAMGVETGRFAPPPEVVAKQRAEAAEQAAPPPVLAMDDTEQAIRNARDLYNAGERLQAAGVLRLAIESHPERVAPWLPLFDLLMRERLVTEFAELARGFRTLHGASPAWKTVQRAGQQIDPGNPLYREHAEAAHQAAA